MREILFRGKRTDNGEWITGDLIENQGRLYIYAASNITTLPWDCKTQIAVCGHEVIPETVGQYTDLCDKNGKKIFEGDILLVKTERESIAKETRHDEYTTKGVVVFEDGAFVLRGKGMVLCTYWGLKRLDSAVKFPECEIIGNIHDTELL